MLSIHLTIASAGICQQLPDLLLTQLLVGLDALLHSMHHLSDSGPVPCIT